MLKFNQKYFSQYASVCLGNEAKSIYYHRLYYLHSDFKANLGYLRHCQKKKCQNSNIKKCDP